MSLRVALFGGAFDPPHFGHTLIINTLLNSGLIDHVWVLPSGARNDKQYHTSEIHRIRMVELMVQEFFKDGRVIVSSADQLHSDPTRGTIDLLTELRRDFPHHDFSFVIGNELLSNLPGWRDPERLKREASFLALPRAGVAKVQNPVGFRVQNIVIDNQLGVSISSTVLRSFCASGLSIEGLVPSSVAQYILLQKLYRRNE